MDKFKKIAVFEEVLSQKHDVVNVQDETISVQLDDKSQIKFDFDDEGDLINIRIIS